MKILSNKLLICLLFTFFACEISYSQSVLEGTENSGERVEVLKIRDKLLQEHEAKKQLDLSLQQIDVLLSGARMMNDFDKQVREYLKINQLLQDTIAELKGNSLRQVELSGEIEQALKEKGLIPQVAGYLREAKLQLNTLGIQQSMTNGRLLKLQENVRLCVRNIPPPKEFVNKAGIKFIFIPGGQDAFYISEKPLGNGNASFFAAVKTAQQMTNSEGAAYRLPAIKEMKLLQARGMQPVNYAIWLASRPGEEDLEGLRIRERFGVNMFMVWDAGRKLGGEVLFPELPNAMYPLLDFHLVTTPKNGWQQRWNQIVLGKKK